MFDNSRFYEDRHYWNVLAGSDANYNMPTYDHVDIRAAFFQNAYLSAPAMVLDMVGRGSKYPITYHDADGDLLDDAHTYKLHLPPGIAAQLYRAVTLYNAADGTMPETPQLLPSRNQFDGAVRERRQVHRPLVLPDATR